VVRYSLIVAAVFAVILASLVIYWEHANSVVVPFPTDAELRYSFDRAAAWTVAHGAQLVDDNNFMLWLFVRESGRLSEDRRLLDLAGEYQSRHARGTVAQFFFDSAGPEQARNGHIELGETWQDYQRLFVYGATCNVEMSEQPGVLALLVPSACEQNLQWLRTPWCRTHQLMGLRFVQKNRCEDDAQTGQTIRAVQDLILGDLNWDFRVDDAYIQKVWTLVESGRRNDIKPIWVQRIMDSQRADGGWDGADIIVRLPGNRVLCWEQGHLYPRVIVLPASIFHPTAQGLYLMALLMQGNREVITRAAD
jgi:hypothetical protein